MYIGTSIGAWLYISLYFANNSSLSGEPGAYPFTGSLIAVGTLKIAFDIINYFFVNVRIVVYLTIRNWFKLSQKENIFAAEK
jgi:hypothetical protein